MKLDSLLFLSVVVFGFALDSRAQATTPDRGTPSLSTAAAPADPADVATMDSIIAALYDAISGPAGTQNWDRFRSLFLPGARLIPTEFDPNGEFVARVLSVEGYIQRTSAILEKQNFFEIQASSRVERFGNIAHVFSTYESRHAKDEAKPFARGINSIQMMYDGKRWWIVNVFWQKEDEKNPLPAEYSRTKN